MSADYKISPTSWIHSLKAKAVEPPERKPLPKKSTPPIVFTDSKRGDNQETLIADIGDGTDAINFLLVAAGCPAEYRPLIDCLVGLAGDRTGWFEADDLAVASRARATEEEFSRDAGRKWVQRWRKLLCEWQQRKNLALIECSPGGQDSDGTRYKSRYKVNLLWLAAQTLEEARNSSHWRRDPSRALELAAPKVLEDTPETPSYKQRFRAPRRDDETLLTRNPKTALTLLEEVARILISRGEDVAEFCKTFTDQATERMLAVHTTTKNQWTDEESQGGLLPKVEAEVRPVDKNVHWSSAPEAEVRPVDKNVHWSSAPEAEVRPVDKNVHWSSTPEAEVRPVDKNVHWSSAPEAEVRPVDKNVHWSSAPEAEVRPVDKNVHWSSAPEAEIALEALQSFEALGASSFSVTLRDEESGRAGDYETFTGAQLREWLPDLLAQNERKRESLIIRPRGASLIQCDDLANDDRERLAPYAFLSAETSPGNYQSWLAMADDLEAPALADVRARLLPSVNADKGANGAMRWPGSLNRKYEDAPLVKLIQCNFFRRVGVAELEQAGLLAPQKPPCDSLMLSMLKPLPKRSSAAEPSYERCERVVKTKRGKIDRSGVDALFAVTCFDWGLAFDRVLELLRLKSSKARSRRDDYAERTATWALSQVMSRA
jgi:hypothetical protein